MAAPVVGLKGFHGRTDSGTEVARYAARTDVLGLNVAAHPLLHHRGKITVRTAEELVMAQQQLGINETV